MVLNRYDKTVNTHAYSTHVIRLHNTMPSHTHTHTQAQTHTYHTYYEYLHLSRYGWRHWHKRWYGVAWQSAIISYTYHATLSHKNKNKSLCCVRVFFSSFVSFKKNYYTIATHRRVVVIRFIHLSCYSVYLLPKLNA